MQSTLPRAARRAVAGAIVACLTVVGTLVAAIGRGADETTVSVDTLRTGWDPNEPGLGPSAVVRPPTSASCSRPRVNGQVYAQPIVVGRHRHRRHREQLGLRPERGDRRHHLVAQRRPGLAGLGHRLRRPGAEHRHHQHAGLRPGDQLGLLHGQGQRRSRRRPPALLPARDQPGDRRRARRLAGDHPGLADQRPGQHVQPKTAAQRPGLLLLDGVVYAGFASHCDYGPYVGYVAGVKTTTPAMSTLWSTEAGPVQRHGRHLAVRRRPGLRRPRPDHRGHRQRRLARARARVPARPARWPSRSSGCRSTATAR